MATEVEVLQINPANNESGVAVDTAFAFSNRKGVYKYRIEKQQRKLLAKIGFIKSFLAEDEAIMLVTTGCSPMSLWEQILTGWIIFFQKRCLLVFTNKRIFHVPTKPNYEYRLSIAQILYGHCRKLRIRGHTLVAVYRNGHREKFFYVRRKEKKKLRDFLKTVSLEGPQTSGLARVHLCPDCGGELIWDRYDCPHCGLLFKDKGEARRISMLYPGGGYFYTGHYILGLLDAIVETGLAAGLLISVFDAVRGVPEALFSAVTLGIILAIEKVTTIYHSNRYIKEYIPK